MNEDDDDDEGGAINSRWSLCRACAVFLSFASVHGIQHNLSDWSNAVGVSICRFEQLKTNKTTTT